MGRIGIVYFSGTGNTKFVAENIKLELEKYHKKVDLINIENNILNQKDYETLIIGGPVYVERYPDILFDYIKKYLKEYKGNCMLFSTQANPNESTVFQHFINKIQFLNITYCMFVPMPNNFFNFSFSKASKEKEDKLIKESIDIVKVNIKNFLDGKIEIYPIKNKLFINMVDKTYKVAYFYFAKFVTKKINIDRIKCNGCRLCERSCPVNCIKISAKIKFNENCTFCQRCMTKCPNEAFIYKNKHMTSYKPDFKKINKVSK